MSSNQEFISKYEQFFSNWLHANLPKSAYWTLISNIDFIIWDYKTKKFYLVELKTHWNYMRTRQKNLYNMLYRRLSFCNDKGLDSRTFVWCYCITFEGSNFQDWRVRIQGSWIRNKTVDEETLKSTLYYLLN